MAHHVRFATFDNVGGANNGLTEADGWQTWADMLTGANALLGAGDTLKIWLKRTASRWVWSDSTAQTFNVSSADNGSFVDLEGYDVSPGDGGKFWMLITNYKRMSIVADNGYLSNFDVYGNYAGELFGFGGQMMSGCKVHNTGGPSSAASESAKVGNIFIGQSSGTSGWVVRCLRGVFVDNVVISESAHQDCVGLSIYTAYRQNLVSGNIVYNLNEVSGGSGSGILIEGDTNQADFSLTKNTVHGFSRGIGTALLRPWSESYFQDIVGNLISKCDTGIVIDDTTRTSAIRVALNGYANCAVDSSIGAAADHVPVSISGNPFIDSAGGDFRLDPTSGAAFIGSFPLGAGKLGYGLNRGAI